ncbi:DUF4926 domain-containing protein [Saccharothrix sp. S26]|uniref:DUF4926 domain-containing protein n=1 Tax=Saccharothrix sp. S26 TaxID=2907215 RepID=UPI001F45292A|nr:DUF4926 domain-containing protein [Saccharothrix sp. S26]MCE6998526.1 DUF4926 domain-containing protein [Saccharothrix sp. S26]
MSFNQFDVAYLSEDLPDEGLKAGTQVTVLEVYDEPALAYEVEVVDHSGVTLFQGAVTADVLVGQPPE